MSKLQEVYKRVFAVRDHIVEKHMQMENPDPEHRDMIKNLDGALKILVDEMLVKPI